MKNNLIYAKMVKVLWYVFIFDVTTIIVVYLWVYNNTNNNFVWNCSNNGNNCVAYDFNNCINCGFPASPKNVKK
jgi:hypothetical protein